MSAHAASTGRPVPGGGRSYWRRLLGVTWRQHRLPLMTVAILLGGFAALLVVQGIGMHAAYQAFGLSYSHPASTARTISFAGTFENEYLGIGMYLPRFLMFLPLVIGAFIGGPLIARELETGTFRFAWTQSVGRARWTLAKLVILGLAGVGVDPLLWTPEHWGPQSPGRESTWQGHDRHTRRSSARKRSAWHARPGSHRRRSPATSAAAPRPSRAGCGRRRSMRARPRV